MRGVSACHGRLRVDAQAGHLVGVVVGDDVGTDGSEHPEATLLAAHEDEHRRHEVERLAVAHARLVHGEGEEHAPQARQRRRVHPRRRAVAAAAAATWHEVGVLRESARQVVLHLPADVMRHRALRRRGELPVVAPASRAALHQLPRAGEAQPDVRPVLRRHAS